MASQTLSPAQARRIALAAQGFADARPAATPDRRHLKRVAARLGLFQIDSVSAVVRAHYMPLYSRLGAYPFPLLDEAMAPGRRRMFFEYWAHEASLLPVETWPLMQWRMRRAAGNKGIYGGLASWAADNRAALDAALREVERRGPLAASDLEGAKGAGGWWGWSPQKRALEWLFWAGRVTTAHRQGFERHYDLPERVIPADVLALPVPDEREAQRALLRISARALGVASRACLCDYFRLGPQDCDAIIPEMVEAGDLIPVDVRGWGRPAFLSPDARLPRRVRARALLSPFDPLVFERGRTEALFGFRYRIEIYTPAAKRQYGYYVLPFLLGEDIVARVDLRADRPAGVLRVLAAFAERQAPPETASELLAELDALRGWLGLARMEVTPGGDLGPRLASLAEAVPETGIEAP